MADRAKGNQVLRSIVLRFLVDVMDHQRRTRAGFPLPDELDWGWCLVTCRAPVSVAFEDQWTHLPKPGRIAGPVAIAGVPFPCHRFRVRRIRAGPIAVCRPGRLLMKHSAALRASARRWELRTLLVAASPLCPAFGRAVPTIRYTDHRRRAASTWSRISNSRIESHALLRAVGRFRSLSDLLVPLVLRNCESAAAPSAVD